MDLARENSYPTQFANSSILPILLLSLMQQKNAPNITKKPFLPEYDYIIVGAGSAGSVVASRLSEVPCVSILLLEAGSSPPVLTDVPGLTRSFWTTDISWNYKTVPQKHTAKAMVDRQVVWPSGKALGGTSIINGMLYVRGTYHNYDDWARQGAVGWSYSDVKPYFLKAENNEEEEFIADGYHAVGGPLTVTKQRYNSILKAPLLEAAHQLGYNVADPNAHNQTGFYDSEGAMRNGQRCSTAKAYLVPAENRTNLHIVPNAFVQKVLIHDKRARGVRFDYEGATHEIRAKREVILSAGAINSAQLLMLSGIGPKRHLHKFKIPVVADLPVGENLQDHLGAYLYFELDPSVPNIGQKFLSNETVEDYIQNRRGVLSSVVTIPFPFLNSPKNPVSDFPDIQMYFEETTAPSDVFTDGLTKDVLENYFKPYLNSSLFRCNVQFLQPKSRGTVRLHSADPFDPPLIDPKYFDNPDDFYPIVEGLKICKNIALSDPMKKFGTKLFPKPFPGCEKHFGNDDDYFKCLAESFVDTLNHQVGTAKMGDPNDPTTVVCPRLKVKGIDGLRVADASIMPIVPSANTNVPSIMVGEKAADMIKNTINCYTQTPV